MKISIPPWLNRINDKYLKIFSSFLDWIISDHFLWMVNMENEMEWKFPLILYLFYFDGFSYGQYFMTYNEGRDGTIQAVCLYAVREAVQGGSSWPQSVCCRQREGGLSLCRQHWPGPLQLGGFQRDLLNLNLMLCLYWSFSSKCIFIKTFIKNSCIVKFFLSS